jgi:hypothetical protein
LTIICLNAPTKITNLNNIAFFDKDIFWLDISVDQSLFMKEINTRANLDEEIESSILTQEFLFAN